MRRLIEDMAENRPPRLVRAWRVWRFPAQYCAAVTTITAISLILRPVFPHATGSTNSDIHGWARPIIGALLLVPVAFAIFDPSLGAFFLVVLTAFTRTRDALEPFSIVPFWLYALLLAGQWMIMNGWSPMELARRLRRGWYGID